MAPSSVEQGIARRRIPGDRSQVGRRGDSRLQQRRDLPDGFATAAFARDDSGKLGEALGLGQHQSGERQRHRGDGCTHGQSRKAAQHFAEVAALKQWRVGRRPDP